MVHHCWCVTFQALPRDQGRPGVPSETMWTLSSLVVVSQEGLFVLTFYSQEVAKIAQRVPFAEPPLTVASCVADVYY